MPGVGDLDLEPVPVPFSYVVDHFRDPHKMQFFCPGQSLNSLCSLAPILCMFYIGQGDEDAYKVLRSDLEKLHKEMVNRSDNEPQRQLWRLQDLRDVWGFGFMVEIALKELSPTPIPHFALYVFRALTSDWRKHKSSHGSFWFRVSSCAFSSQM